MPRRHREFLHAVEREPDIGTFVHTHSQNEQLRKAYADCLNALARFRNFHIQMVTRYVVLPAERRRREKNACANGAFKPKETGRPVSIAGANGTGGTRPIEFLKSVRDDVIRATE
jgi:indoleamine 2,3-dioxygenase